MGALVPVKVKNKIWANDYVDLRSLLPNHEQDPFTLTVTSGSINVQHNAKAKKNLCLCIIGRMPFFFNLTCIYFEKFPLEAPHLLKYLSFVREMSKLHGETAWRNYDESYRHLKENSNLPWQKSV